MITSEWWRCLKAGVRGQGLGVRVWRQAAGVRRQASGPRLVGGLSAAFPFRDQDSYMWDGRVVFGGVVERCRLGWLGPNGQLSGSFTRHVYSVDSWLSHGKIVNHYGHEGIIREMQSEFRNLAAGSRELESP